MRDELRSCCLKVNSFFRKVMKLLFSHVGLCGLVTAYAVAGAFMFEAIERPFEETLHGKIKAHREMIVTDLYKFVNKTSVMEQQIVRDYTHKLLRDFEHALVQAVNFEGYDEQDELSVEPRYQWTKSGALLYSITVFTTIGYGHICPKTTLGRCMTILYAMLGIPLMLLCLANIAETLAQVFTFIYFKICCLYCRWQRNRRRVRRAALSMRYHGYVPGDRMRRGQSVRRGHYSQVRRRPSMTKSLGQGPGMLKKSYASGHMAADARSVRSMNPNAVRQTSRDRDRDRLPPGDQKWDTRSLSLNQQGVRNKRSIARSPHNSPPRNDYDHVSFGKRSGNRLANKYDGRANKPGLSERRRPITGAEDTTFDDRGTQRAKGVYVISGVPVRYVNNGDGKATFELRAMSKTHSGSGFGSVVSTRQTQKSLRSQVDSPLKPSTSASSDIQKLRDDDSDEPKPLPQITVSDNEKETTSGQITGSDEDDYDDDHMRGHVHAHHVPPQHVQELIPHRMQKMPSTDASSSRRSERSDELSMKSASRRHQKKEEKMPVSVGIVTVVAFICGGAILFSIWEEWNIFDGAYYSFITLSTIGFGDMVPGQSLDQGSQEKMIITSLYLLFGMALIAMCFKLMQDDVVQKARWLGQKIGILVQEDSSDDESEMEEEEDEFEEEYDEEVDDY